MCQFVLANTEPIWKIKSNKSGTQSTKRHAKKSTPVLEFFVSTSICCVGWNELLLSCKQHNSKTMWTQVCRYVCLIRQTLLITKTTRTVQATLSLLENFKQAEKHTWIWGSRGPECYATCPLQGWISTLKPSPLSTFGETILMQWMGPVIFDPKQGF